MIWKDFEILCETKLIFLDAVYWYCYGNIYGRRMSFVLWDVQVELCNCSHLHSLLSFRFKTKNCTQRYKHKANVAKILTLLNISQEYSDAGLYLLSSQMYKWKFPNKSWKHLKLSLSLRQGLIYIRIQIWRT